METPRGWSVAAGVGNSVTAQMRWEGDVTLATTEDGGKTRRAGWTFSVRPGPRWRLSIEPSYEYQVDSQQYVTTLSGGRPETFGNRYIFAYIERSTLSAQCRLSFTLKPDVNLDAYVEPFTASGRYYDYGELLAPGSGERISYGTAGTTMERQEDGSRRVTAGGSAFTLGNDDFNVRSFRSNVVLYWEWRPGSTLYIVWQQDRSISEAIGSRVGAGDLLRSITAPGSNTFLVKTSFWLPLG
jgi:hypothetical protein